MKRLITVVLACLVPVLASAQVVILPGGGGSSTITPNGIATATYCTDAGVTDAYACSLPSAPTYAAGLCLSFKAATANTGAATVNFNGVGAVTIVKVESGNPTTLADNDIRVGSVVNVCHDGTNFQMQSTLGAVPPGGGDALTSSTLAQFAATTSAQLATVMSDEVGTDKLVYNTSPTLVTPILGVAAGTSLDLSANLTTENGVNYCLDAVGTDAYACSLSPAITAYVTGAIYTFKAGTANTGAASLNLNGIGAKTIVKTAGGITTALADNDIRSGSVVSVAYDGTNLQLISPVANAGGGSGSPGGSDTQIQYNNSGSFGGASTMTRGSDGGITIGTGLSGTVRGLVVDSATSNGNPLTIKDNGTDVAWFEDGGGLTVPSIATTSTSATMTSPNGFCFESSNNQYIRMNCAAGSVMDISTYSSRQLFRMTSAVPDTATMNDSVEFHTGNAVSSSGFGSSIGIFGPSTTTLALRMGGYGVAWSNATHASRSSYAQITSVSNAVEAPASYIGVYKNLTDNTATTFVVQTLGNDTGGCSTFTYTVYAADATTSGLEGGNVTFCGSDVTAGAGGESCSAGTAYGNLQNLQGSTLAVTFAATTGTDLCNFRITVDTNIATPVSLWIKWTAINSGRVLTPQ